VTGRERDRQDPTFHIHPTSEVQPARCSSTALDSPGLCDGVRTSVRTRDTLPVSWLPSLQQPHIIVPQYAECPPSCQVELSLQAGPKRSIFLQELLASSPATATAEAGTNWCMIDIARQKPDATTNPPSTIPSNKVAELPSAHHFVCLSTANTLAPCKSPACVLCLAASPAFCTALCKCHLSYL
jgi:hypothetical protein